MPLETIADLVGHAGTEPPAEDLAGEVLVGLGDAGPPAYRTAS